MAHVQVVFASNYGHTRRVAEHVAARARAAGHTAALSDVTHDPDQPLAPAGLTVLASAIYTGQHPSMIRFARQHASALASRDAVFLSVSLAAASDSEQAEDMTWTYVDDFGADTGWSPRRVTFVGGALAMDAYDVATRALVKVAVWCRGLDATGRTDFTDWAALDRAIDGWLAPLARM